MPNICYLRYSFDSKVQVDMGKGIILSLRIKIFNHLKIEFVRKSKIYVKNSLFTKDCGDMEKN